jgi:hypothetical protein
MNVKQYLVPMKRIEKSSVTGIVLSAIKAGSGQFLQQKQGHQGWFLVNDKLSKIKISHALRDALALRKTNQHFWFPSTTTTCSQQVSASDERDVILFELLSYSVITDTSFLSSQSILEMDSKEESKHFPDFMIEPTTLCQLMMAEMIYQEDFFAPTQHQPIPEEDKEFLIKLLNMIEDHNNDNGHKEAFNLARSIKTCGTCEQWQPDSSCFPSWEYMNYILSLQEERSFSSAPHFHKPCKYVCGGMLKEITMKVGKASSSSFTASSHDEVFSIMSNVGTSYRESS